MAFLFDPEERQQPELFEGYEFVVNTNGHKLSREQKETVMHMVIDGLHSGCRLNEIGINIMMDYLKKSYIVHVSQRVDSAYQVDIY